MKITITLTDLVMAEIDAIENGLHDKSGLNAKIAGDTEAFLKEIGPRIAADASQHKNANRLGAQPTDHLARQYAAIEAQSDADVARLLIPRAGRLRAAFGPYTVEPGPGKTYLTLPVHREAYGRRAGEFDNLFYAEVGPYSHPVLARLGGFSAITKKGRPGINAQLEIFYDLRTSVDIDEEPDLIPWGELQEQAADSAEAYIDELISASLA